MDRDEFERRERDAVAAAHAGACKAVGLIPGESPWARAIWHWGHLLERALLEHGRVGAPEPDSLPAGLLDDQRAA